MWLHTLIAFRPIQVTVIVSITYTVLLALLFSNHFTVPQAPDDETPVSGINQTRAWRDLEELSSAYRPWNSNRNGRVRQWLGDRIEALIKANGHQVEAITSDPRFSSVIGNNDVILLRDDDINVTIVDSRRQPPLPAFIESQNVLVYVRGSEDEPGPWWQGEYCSRRGVLVNAHYDSVSTGYGATDDGVGVVTVLQLISHFTTPGNQPRRGIVFLLNNGEEDGLYGASTFSQHPWSSFPGVFLNLEGAGAGGRAALFRSTDTEVTKLYKTANPFGTVLTADGFKRGLVRSDTDYTVFTRSLDIRGLDVAFVAPRSRYHTDQDATRETSRDSVWHMLSMASSTTRTLASTEIEWDSLSTTSSDSGVWFDIFGASFVVISIHTFSVLCICALFIGPILLGLVVFLLVRYDRWYPFLPTGILAVGEGNDAKHGSIYRTRGLLRTPIAFVSTGILLAGIADFIAAKNPYIMYRSPFLLWTTFLTATALVNWIVLRLADHSRLMVSPDWRYKLGNELTTWWWLSVLVVNFTLWIALMLGTIEFAVLPRRSSVVQVEVSDELAEEAASAEPSEQTPLLNNHAVASTQTFTGIARSQPAPSITRVEVLLASDQSDDLLGLNTWTWLLQFLVIAPINIIILGQIALFTITALHQTPADGNPLSTIFQAMSLFAILLVLPILPFIHKLRGSLASLLLLVLLFCFIWSSMAAPFSRDARLKYYFLQQVDLEQQTSNVSLTTVQPYLHEVIDQAPSASGQARTCTAPGQGLRRGLSTCYWDADAAGYNATLVRYSIDVNGTSSAIFTIEGTNTKSCRILFNDPVEHIEVFGSTTDVRDPKSSTNNATQIRLYSRESGRRFEVGVAWPESTETKTGRIGCVWSELEYVPAIKELQLFAPSWSALTKNDDGLVEGWYEWSLTEHPP